MQISNEYWSSNYCVGNFFTAVENASGKKKSDDKSPKIVDHLTSMYVKDGEAVTLSCRIIGAKKFDVVWLHNNKEIKPSKDFQYTNEANIYKLIIAEIFPEDSGTYTCEAFNDAGESYSSCTLNVLGKELLSGLICIWIYHLCTQGKYFYIR